MIKKIKKLDFRIFRNFNGESLNFEKDNLIFGWNYSGKTTLFDFFQVLEDRTYLSNGSNPSFEIIENDLSIKDLPQTNDLNIKVFNKKYVEKNLDIFGEVGAMKLALGKENVKDIKELSEIQNAKDILEKSLTKIGFEIEKINKNNIDIDEKVREVKSNKARIINSLISDTFTATNLGRYILPENIALSNDDLKKETGKLNQSAVENIKFDTSALSIDRDKMKEISNILEKEIILQESISEIDDSPDRKQWVECGIRLHKDVMKCLFCDNKIPEGRVEKLTKYFSKAYTDTEQEVSRQIEYIESLISRIATQPLPSKNDFLSINQNRFGSLNTNEAMSNYRESVEEIKRKLVSKKGNIILKIDSTGLKEEYVFSIPALSELIEKNNRENKNITKIKEDALEKIKKHYGKEAYIEIENKNKKIVETNRLIMEKTNIGNKMKFLAKQEEKIRSETSELSNCVSKLNNLIESFLGSKEITLGDLDENAKTMRFKRGDRDATNLSEGERAIIAFAYFYLSLKSNANTIDKTIVLIDDPISSFDDNHLSYMSAFIREELVGKCKQLFISTHNFTFFDHLRVSKVRFDKEDRIENQFFVENYEDNKKNRCARLIELPDMIRNYKSDYLYLFSQIEEFSKYPNPLKYEKFPMIPNALRRFMETYCGIMYPNGKGWKYNLKFIKDNNLRTSLKAIADGGSHGEGAGSTNIVFNNPEELQRIIKETLICIRKKDNKYYNCLETTANQKIEIKTKK